MRDVKMQEPAIDRVLQLWFAAFAAGKNQLLRVRVQQPAKDLEQMAARLEFGQQLRIKDFLELRVLVRGPLVEQVKRPVLEIRGQQREPFALALRQFDRGQPPVPDLDLVIEMKLRQVTMRLAVQGRA